MRSLLGFIFLVMIVALLYKFQWREVDKVSLTHPQKSWSLIKKTWPKYESDQEKVAFVNEVPIFYANIKHLSKEAQLNPKDRLLLIIQLELMRQGILNKLQRSVTVDEVLSPPTPNDYSWSVRTSSLINKLIITHLKSLEFNPIEVIPKSYNSLANSVNEPSRTIQVLSIPRKEKTNAENYLINYKLSEVKRLISARYTSFEEAIKHQSPKTAPFRGSHKLSRNCLSTDIPKELCKLAFSTPLGLVSDPYTLNTAIILIKPISELMNKEDSNYQKRRLKAYQKSMQLRSLQAQLLEQAQQTANILIPSIAFGFTNSKVTKLIQTSLPSIKPRG